MPAHPGPSLWPSRPSWVCPTIAVSITPDGCGLTKLCRSVRHLDSQSRSLISLAGPVSETKFSGAKLTVPVADIWDAMWSLCQLQKPPRSDTANIARCLMGDGIRDHEALREVLDERVETVRQILDRPEVWQAIERLAEALVWRGRLDEAGIVEVTGYDARLANEARRMHDMIEAAAAIPVPPHPPYRHKRLKPRWTGFQLRGQ
jgi:hypothetical protein